MANLKVDYAEASATVIKIRDHTQRFKDAHGGQAPVFDAASAGRGFTGHGQRLATLLAQLHQRAGERAETMDLTAQAAQREVDRIYNTDLSNSDAFGRIQGGA